MPVKETLTAGKMFRHKLSEILKTRGRRKDQTLIPRELRWPVKLIHQQITA